MAAIVAPSKTSTVKRRPAPASFKDGGLFRAHGAKAKAKPVPASRPSALPAPAAAPAAAPKTAKPAGALPPSPIVTPSPASAEPSPKPAKKPTIASLRKPKAFVPPSAKRTTPIRPSLSQQLAGIGGAAEAFTNSLLKKHGMEEKETPLFTAPSRNFVVGRVSSRFPSPVKFLRNMCTYVFHHPFSKAQITMEMYYADLVDVKLSNAARTLQFRVRRNLENFGDDYNPANRQHVVLIEFNSTSDIERIRELVLPVLTGHSRAGAGRSVRSSGGAGGGGSVRLR